MHFRNEMAQHRFRHFKIRDYAIFQRANRNNIGRRAAEHAFGFIADSQHARGPRLHRDHGRLTQDNALIFDVDERIGRAEVDTDVAG